MKLHRAVAPETPEIPAAVVGAPGGTEAEAVPAPREPGEDPVAKATGDGMDDRREGYEARKRRSARAGIPPRRDATVIRHGNSSGPRRDRDENLRRIRQIGRKPWQEGSGDPERARGEAARFRRETSFGPGASGRRDEPRAPEVGVRGRALHLRTPQGMPEAVRGAA